MSFYQVTCMTWSSEAQHRITLEQTMPDFLSKSMCGPKRLNILHFSALFPIMEIRTHLVSLCFPTFVKLCLSPFLFRPQMLLLIYFGYCNPHIVFVRNRNNCVHPYFHMPKENRLELWEWGERWLHFWNSLEQQNTFNYKEIFKTITLLLALQKHSA